MTGNNTTPGEKLRAIFLAVLMVGSALAMGVAFTGGAAANVDSSSLGTIANQDTVGDTFTVNISVDAGDQVTVENYVDGEIRESFTATDNGTNDLDGANNSKIEVELTAGKTYNGSSKVVVTGPNGNTDTAMYNTSNYLVELDEGSQSVTQGETTTIEGMIYEYPGALVNDHTVDYELVYDPDVSNQSDEGAETVLASSDTGSGQFQTVRTFDEVDEGGFENDYPTDDAEVGSSAQPSYVVYVMENNTAADADFENEGHAQIDTRLNVEGTVAEQDGDGTAIVPTYGQTVDIVDGMVENADGGLANYALRVEDPTGSTQKTTTSASDGSFGFTLELNDAGTWNLGTNEGAFIDYQDIVVDAQQADLQFTAEGNNLATFEETYNIQLNDSEDNFPLITNKGGDVSSAEGHVQGYINVTGPFLADSFDDTQDGVIDNDTAEDGVIDYVHIATDNSGAASFNATPAQDADVTATLELEHDGETYNGLEQADDAANSPTEPDYVASENIPLGGADPVNVIDASVEDPQTVNAELANEDLANYINILEDGNGPAVVEVLPLADNVDDRINNSERFGFDGNQDIDGMTVYRVSFELRNETNAAIVPNGSVDGTFADMHISGAGINATISADTSLASNLSVDSQNGNVLDANYTNVDDDSRTEYAFLIRPTSTDEADEQIVHEVNVVGEDTVEVPLDAAGLQIEEFIIGTNATQSILGDQTVDLSAVVNAPYDDFAPVNNGLVRLTQSGYDLDTETDARTSNVNDGEYEFENITIGPRGIDDGSDGLADDISQLTFTAYQYSDLNPPDKALEQQEVDHAAVRTVELDADDTLQVEYLPENTSDYSGFKTTEDGDVFTLTKGVEYDQIAFELTNASGGPVDLTEGIGGEDVSLNELDDAKISDELFVKIVDPDGTPHEVHFDEDASDPVNGTYVIDDIQDSDYVDSDGADTDPRAGDAFGFTNNSDRDADAFQLQITTPDASYKTADDEGVFHAANPSIDTTIVGVNVNETTYETFDVDHTTEDNFTSLEGVDTMTISDNRWYRVEGQVTDALGTPINGTMLDETELGFLGGAGDSDADIEFIDAMGNSPVDSSVVELNNESGLVLFDIKPTDANNNGEFTPKYNLSAYTSSGFDTDDGPTAEWYDTPEGQLPRVQVYDQSGALLPGYDDPEQNLILANDVTQTIRVEAFPADQNDLPVQRLNYAINTATDPVNENTINTLTEMEDASVLVTDNDAPYPNVPYEQGQVGYLTVTPTGTGEGIIALRSGNATGPITKTIEGANITFDVLRSNKQVNLDIASETAAPGGSVNVTVTAAATGDPINLAEVSLEDPNGNVIESETTDENGMVSIPVPASASLGEYSLTTRPAGYQPITESFTVSAPAQLDEDLELFAADGQVISGTTSEAAGTTYTIEVSGPGLVDTADATVQDDGTFSAAFDLSDLSAGDQLTASINGDEVTYTLQEPPVATVDFRSQQSESGDAVTVREAYLPEGGFIVIHDADGNVIGHSDYFEPGTVEDVEILLSTSLPAFDSQVTAMPHLDDNDNQAYDFPDADAPYTDADGNPVTDTATVRVPGEPANFEVTTLDAPATVTQGDDVTATATVENTGDAEATQTVEFRFAGDVVGEEEVTLAGGESQTVEFTVSTEGVDAGTYTHGVYTDDDQMTAQLTIEAEQTPTPTETTTTTTTTEEGDGGGPGFGIAVALVALLGAALLAVRRNN